jgi:excisionase family DNA binding protein
MKSYLTPKQLAFEYDVSETTVIRWCRTGYLPSIKVGGHWRIGLDVDLESLSNPMNEQVREGMKSRGWYRIICIAVRVSTMQQRY